MRSSFLATSGAPAPLALAAATLLSLHLPAAHAQAGADTLAEIEVRADTGPTELQGRRARVTLAPTGLPSALGVITPREIETLNVGRDISNIFRRVSGVVANNIDQGDTGNGFRMRGFATQGTHGADTAVYVDGVPQNMPSSQAGAGHGPAFLEWLTPEMIGGVTVIKGPVSALYGDQNRAGAVAIRTADGGELPSSLGLSLEQYRGRRGSLVLSHALDEGWRSLLVADVYRTDSYRRDGRTERDNLMWKLSRRIGEGVYSLRLNHYESSSRAAGYLLLPDLQSGRLDPRGTQYNLPGFGSGQRSAIVLERRPAEGEAGWYATAWAERFERARGISTSETQHTVGSDNRHLHGARLSHNTVFGDRAALAAGLEWREDGGDAQRQIHRWGLPTTSFINNQSLDLRTWGLFAQGQLRVGDQLKLLAGVRRDEFDYRIVNRKLPLASTHYEDGVTTPRLGVVWSASPRLDLFANLAEGLRSPAAEQISSSGATGPLYARGGTVYDVSPSKVRSLDLGFTAAPLEGLSVSGVVYRTLNQDEIVAQADGSFRSVGDTTRRGLDLEARWRVNGAWSAYGSYGRILQAAANNPLPNTGARLSVPRHTLKAGVEWQRALGAGRLTLNADAYLTAGNPYYVGSPQVQPRTMPTYTRYDLKASYALGQAQWSLWAIFQPHRFASDIAYGTSAGLLVSPQARTQVGASVRYFF